jgi:hypothetical protein
VFHAAGKATEAAAPEATEAATAAPRRIAISLTGGHTPAACFMCFKPPVHLAVLLPALHMTISQAGPELGA